MPVQFVCQQCRKRLSVSHRKQGAVVNCPNCGQPNVVPEEQAAQPSAAMAAAAQQGPNYPAIPEVVVFDDVPELIAEQQRVAPPPVESASGVAMSGVTKSGSPASKTPANKFPPNPAPAPPGLASPASSSSSVWSSPVAPQTPVQTPRGASQVAARLKPRPEDALLLMSRRAVYALGGLLLGVALFAFLAGFLIGRDGRPAQRDPAQSGETAQGDPVALEGSVIYSTAPGNYQGDANSVAIAVPADKPPAQTLPSAGLRATDADESLAAPAGAALRAQGGALARANSAGDFQLVVPQPGDFHLLLVSRHAKRPEGTEISSQDLADMARYFADPAGLIGGQKYEWTPRRLVGAPLPISRDFGADGK
jgi:predicted RNA-binding Zn-ribbon protein involved in translation (DUF1610 family)